MLQSGTFLELQSAIVATRASERMTLEQLAACLDDPFCAGKMKLKDEVTINSGDNSTIGFNLTVNAGGSGRTSLWVIWYTPASVLDTVEI
jgi:hypothetical protein